MKIEIDKKTGALLAVIVLLAGTVIGLAVSRNFNDDMGMDHMHGMNSSSNSNYTGADIMFLQMMIPHHQQAVDISELALKVSQDPELRALAKTISTAQKSEIVTMKAWLKDAEASLDMGHSMSGMGGMLSATELADLKAATGKTFDRLWLKGMTGHHDGAIHMTTMIRDASNPEIKAFGENVVKDQSAQIKQMELMFKRIG
jgi:uncharacterized protein (DUF305 family)